MAESIILTIQAEQCNMTKTEQKLAQFLLANPQRIIALSANELAEQADVSSATVIRFSRKVGADGFTDLKLKLSAAQDIDESLYSELAPDDDIDTLKGKLSFRISHALQKTNEILKPNTLKQAVQAINQSTVIYTFGLGASRLVADDFSQKFARLGKTIIQAIDPHKLATELCAQTLPTLLLVVSNSGETSETNKVAAIAQQEHIPVLVVTSNPDSTLAELGTTVIQTISAENEETLRTAATTSIMTQLYSVDLLYYAFLQGNYQANIEKIATSYETVSKFFR